MSVTESCNSILSSKGWKKTVNIMASKVCRKIRSKLSKLIFKLGTRFFFVIVGFCLFFKGMFSQPISQKLCYMYSFSLNKLESVLSSTLKKNQERKAMWSGYREPNQSDKANSLVIWSDHRTKYFRRDIMGGWSEEFGNNF